MATAQLRISIDGASDDQELEVAPGGVLSGAVEIIPAAEVLCRHVWLRAGWHTEGKGDRNKKSVYRNDLWQKTIQSGERLAFPYAITLPVMPWSYTGHYVSIEWTISLELDVPWSKNPKLERRFRMRPGAVPMPQSMPLQNADSSPIANPASSLSLSAFPDTLPVQAPLPPLAPISSAPRPIQSAQSWPPLGKTISIKQMPSISPFSPQFKPFSLQVIGALQSFQPTIDTDLIVQHLQSGSGDLLTGVPERDVDLLRRRLEGTGLKIEIR